MVNISFDRLDLDQITKLEWLVTNGIGGFASGTMSGVLTRRYHGLLVAAVNPPVERVNLVPKIDEIVIYQDQVFQISRNRWNSGASSIDPKGGLSELVRFHLDGSIPTWSYKFDHAMLNKQVWMEHGKNTTYLHYVYVEGDDELTINLESFLGYTDFHQTNKISSDFEVSIVPPGVKVKANPDAPEYFLLSDLAQAKQTNGKILEFYLSEEDYRGLDAVTTFFHGVGFQARLLPGNTVTIVITTDPDADLDGINALDRRMKRDLNLIKKNKHSDDPEWVQQLVLSADQFIVKRNIGQESGHSVIAGYPWFSDWGRDTMIALPGLALSTGRLALAESILRTFSRYVDRGMLPNRFPDLGEEPEYNTIDATLWYFEAIYRTYRLVNELDKPRAIDFIKDLFPILENIIKFHQAGTRFNIHVDPNDGLIYGGEPGVQLTWMDAKVEGFVVTPREGKPVEINALWYSALRIMAEFANALGQKADKYLEKAEKVLQSFDRFWNEDLEYCFDVLDGPTGNDPSLRPNQVLALAVAFPPLSVEKQKKVLDCCANYLLTPVGLRSLAADHREYIGNYGGNIWKRDTAYHQGTVWGWLIGPYLSAHLRVFNDRDYVLSQLEIFVQQLNTHGLGSISEIFDGDFPHTPRGCIAQAWSVASALQVWNDLRLK